MQKTFMLKKETVDRKWFIIDATDLVLGRLSTEVANILRGKNKPTYTPHVDSGDHVIIINADKVRLTGNKEKNKIYYRHTGHPGGLKARTAGDFLANNPDDLIKNSIKGMIPAGPLGRQQLRKLYVYTGSEHPHAAQNPEVYNMEK